MSQTSRTESLSDRAAVSRDQHSDALHFGPFSLSPLRRQLFEDGLPVRLSARALDILIFLTARAGTLVDNNDLMQHVWPRARVETNTLRVHLGALRKVLGDGQAGARYIINDPGRGYIFVAPIQRSRQTSLRGDQPGQNDLADRLPAPATRMIGRATTVASIHTLLSEKRLVSLVGPGGIGKTTVAIATAHALGANYRHGVYFIDLAPLEDAQLVTSAVAIGLGLSMRSGDGQKPVLDFLASRSALVVFDNCEHVAAVVTPLIEELLRAAPKVHVLVTSREPLRAEGEQVHRLSRLAAPEHSDGLDPEQALNFPAVQLFVERATAVWNDFTLNADSTPLVSDLCRRLDGNPLAIELVASRIDLFGLQGLADQFGEHVLNIGHHRRTASPRHRSLGALLDWSYDNLSPPEQLAFCHLSVFKSRFSLDAASQYLGVSLEVSSSAALDLVLSLGDKSLLSVDASVETIHARLPELTRAYARQKLESIGLHALAARTHAALMLTLFSQASGAWTTMKKSEWFDSYVWAAEDVRAALAWSFGENGDTLTGAQLAATIWPLVLVHQAFNHSQELERALLALERMPDRHPELEIRLHIAQATFLQLDTGASQRIASSANRALVLAEQARNPKLLAESLMSMTMLSLAQGDYTAAIQNAEPLEAAVQSSADPVTTLMSKRVGAQMSHFAGRHARARELAEGVLKDSVLRGRLDGGLGMVDHRVSMRIVLARILWIQGFCEQAHLMSQELMTQALSDGPASICQAIALGACPIAMWRGDSFEAERLAGLLRATLTDQRRWGGWQPAAGSIPWWLIDPFGKASAMNVNRGLRSLDVSANVLQLDHLITTCPDLVDILAVNRASEEGWCAPELLRAHATMLLRDNSIETRALAETVLMRALDMAARQGALGWELRIVIDLAALRQDSRPAEARKLLEGVYSRFTEGFETADLRCASRLLATMD